MIFHVFFNHCKQFFLLLFPDTIESDANETTIKASKKKRKASGTQSKPTQVGMVVLYIIYSNLVLLDYMIFSNF